MHTPFVVRGFNSFDVKENSDASGLECLDRSLTHQSFAEEADINVIIDRFGIGYSMPEGVRPPMYGDFTDITDYRGAMDRVVEARESFMALPAQVRSQFANDPHLFVEFCSDAENLPKLRKWGFAVPEKPVPGAAASAAPVVAQTAKSDGPVST